MGEYIGSYRAALVPITLTILSFELKTCVCVHYRVFPARFQSQLGH